MIALESYVTKISLTPQSSMNRAVLAGQLAPRRRAALNVGSCRRLTAARASATRSVPVTA